MKKVNAWICARRTTTHLDLASVIPDWQEGEAKRIRETYKSVTVVISRGQILFELIGSVRFFCEDTVSTKLELKLVIILNGMVYCFFIVGPRKMRALT